MSYSNAYNSTVNYNRANSANNVIQQQTPQNSQRGISAIDRRSQQIADYVAAKNAAKVNAEQLKLQRTSTLQNTTNIQPHNGTTSGYNTARTLNNGIAAVTKPSSATRPYNATPQHSAPNTERMIGNEWQQQFTTDNNVSNISIRRQSQQRDLGNLSQRDSINTSQPYIQQQQPEPVYQQPRAPAHPRSANSQNGHAAHRPLSNGPHHIPPTNIDTELYNRINVLEEQVRLLKHQNRLFLSFMQATEQQLTALNNNNNNQSINTTQQQHSRPSSGRHSVRNNNDNNTTTNTSVFSPPVDNAADQSRMERTKQAKIAELQRLKSKQSQIDDMSDVSSINSVNDSRYSDNSATKQFDQRQQQRTQTNNKPQQTPQQKQQQQRPPSSNNQSTYEPTKYNDTSSSKSPIKPIRQPSQDITINESNAAFAAAIDDTADTGELQSCPDCGRSFNPTALRKHIDKRLCQQKPRKVFDLTKKRIEAAVLPGENIKQVLATVKKAVNDDSKPVKAIPKWKLDHMKFQEALQHGKAVTDAINKGVDPRNIPQLQSTTADDRVPCPHCSRRFNATVAERHIPHCKNTVNKPAAVGSKMRR